MHPGFDRFRKLATQPFSFRLFLMKNLPAGLFARLRVIAFDKERCAVRVPFTWFSRNPFRSMYFAVQAMAAELSTGALAMGQVYQRQPALSLIVIGVEGSFHKKATGTIVFTCEDGVRLRNAADQALETGDAVTVPCRSVGRNSDGEVVSVFTITWSFKSKKRV